MDLEQFNEEVTANNTGSGRKSKNKKNKGGQQQAIAQNISNANQSGSNTTVGNAATDGETVSVEIPPPPHSPSPSPVPQLFEDLPLNGKDPLHLLGSREAERNLLIILNKRFEKIIEKNRKLQQENQQLETQIHVEQLQSSAKVTELTSKANHQLDDVRDELTQARKEIATLNFVLDDSRKEADQLTSRLQKADDEAAEDKHRIADLEGQVDELNYELKRSLDQNKKLDKELKDWKNQAIKGGETLQEARAQLEKETFLRLDIEKELNNKLNDSYLKMTINETEIAQVKAYTNNLLSDQSEKQQKEFENILEENLRNLRDEYRRKLEENKNEQEKLYTLKEADHIAKKESLAEDLKDKDGQLKTAQTKIKGLTDSVRKLEGERHGLIVQLDDLEAERTTEREKLEKEIANRDKMLQIKVIEKNELVSQCQHLLDVKVALDNELATYRLLLETEESRLEIGDAAKMDVNQNYPSSQSQTA